MSILKKVIWKGFTLVELIVVITILSILALIGFISFTSYTYYARDGVRVSDIKSIQSSLSIFHIEKWFLPKPSSGVPVTYSGTTLRTQWFFDNQLFANVGKINKKPVDPLTSTEYTYSVLENGQEYELAAAYESSSISYSPLIESASADFRYAIVKGTYNGRMIQSDVGSNRFIFAIPSIINTWVSSQTIQDIIQNKQIVIDGLWNIPQNYAGKGWSLSWAVDWNVSSNQFIVFSWTLDQSKTSTGILQIISNLQNVYKDTILAKDKDIEPILALDPIWNASEAVAQMQIIINGGVDTWVQTQTIPTPSSSPELYCWWDGWYWKLWDETTQTKMVPTKVSLLSGVTNFTTPITWWNQSCSYSDTGSLYCWGYNFNGVLWIHPWTVVTTSIALQSTLPPWETSLSNVHIGVNNHACWIGNSGNLYCWWDNAYGKLWTGTINTGYHIPQKVDLPVWSTSFTKVTTWHNHTCALTNTGKAYCWGQNDYGQLWVGTGNTTNYSTPTEVYLPSWLTGFSSISTFWKHTCGIGNNGKAYCWWYNITGALWRAYANLEIPGQVTFPSWVTSFTQVSAGENYTCWIGNNGKAYCWWWNYYAQLWNGDTGVGSSFSPIEIVSPSWVSSYNGIFTWTRHACAIWNDSKAYCWGQNGSGQWWYSTGWTNSSSPSMVILPAWKSGVSNLSLWSMHTCGMVY